uniref:SGNH hydrolase-type esterase domain-containing protein n=1 Tax=Eutreptiella gymnastica TaxID=73025 RepID=A0A7S1HXX9_9EUGL
MSNGILVWAMLATVVGLNTEQIPTILCTSKRLWCLDEPASYSIGRLCLPVNASAQTSASTMIVELSHCTTPYGGNVTVRFLHCNVAAPRPQWANQQFGPYTIELRLSGTHAQVTRLRYRPMRLSSTPTCEYWGEYTAFVPGPYTLDVVVVYTGYDDLNYQKVDWAAVKNMMLLRSWKTFLKADPSLSQSPDDCSVSQAAQWAHVEGFWVRQHATPFRLSSIVPCARKRHCGCTRPTYGCDVNTMCVCDYTWLPTLDCLAHASVLSTTTVAHIAAPIPLEPHGPLHPPSNLGALATTCLSNRKIFVLGDSHTRQFAQTWAKLLQASFTPAPKGQPQCFVKGTLRVCHLWMPQCDHTALMRVLKKAHKVLINFGQHYASGRRPSPIEAFAPMLRQCLPHDARSRAKVVWMGTAPLTRLNRDEFIRHGDHRQSQRLELLDTIGHAVAAQLQIPSLPVYGTLFPFLDCTTDEAHQQHYIWVPIVAKAVWHLCHPSPGTGPPAEHLNTSLVRPPALRVPQL